MLTAHANTTTEDFIAQLRTFIIAFGCNACVIDCVDKLAGSDELESKHAADLEEAELAAETRGRESMKSEILEVVNSWLDDQVSIPPELDKALQAVIEKIEV